MTNYYKATIDGVTVTRSTTGRAYSHVLVGYVDIAKARVGCEKAARVSHAKHIATCTKEANGQTCYLDWCSDEKMLGMFLYDLTPEQKAAKRAERHAEYMARHIEQVEGSKAALAADKGVEAWVANALAEFDARRAAADNNSTDGRYYICDLGWAGRLDLAEKNLAAHRKPGYGYDRLVILEAVQCEKRPKPSKSKATR